jgi:hypothetical protein
MQHIGQTAAPASMRALTGGGAIHFVLRSSWAAPALSRPGVQITAEINDPLVQLGDLAGDGIALTSDCRGLGLAALDLGVNLASGEV